MVDITTWSGNALSSSVTTSLDTWEAKSRPSAIERLVSFWHTHGCDLEAPTHSRGRGMRPEDYVAGLSGLNDPMAERAFTARYLGDHHQVPWLVDTLDAWGWHRWRVQRRHAAIDPDLHLRLAEHAVNEYLAVRRLPYRELVRSIGVGEHRWKSLRLHYQDLVSKLENGEVKIARHLAEKWGWIH